MAAEQSGTGKRKAEKNKEEDCQKRARPLEPLPRILFQPESGEAAFWCTSRITFSLNELSYIDKVRYGIPVPAYKGNFGNKNAVVIVAPQTLRKDLREVKEVLEADDQNPNVLRFYGAEWDASGQYVYVAVEATYGTLKEYCIALRYNISADIIRQMIDALGQLHSASVVYEDRSQLRGRFHRNFRIVSTKRSPLLKMTGFTNWRHLSESTSRNSDEYGMLPFKMNADREAFARGLGSFLYECFMQAENSAVVGPSEAFVLARELSFDLWRRPQPLGEVRPGFSRSTADLFTDHTHNHPYFWNSDRKQLFYEAVAGGISMANTAPDSYIQSSIKELKEYPMCIIGGDWLKRFPHCIIGAFPKRFKYDGTSVLDLIRAIRNILAHHMEYMALHAHFRSPEQVMRYVSRKFPLLLLHTYTAMWWCKDAPWISSFYYQGVQGYSPLARDNLYWYSRWKHVGRHDSYGSPDDATNDDVVA